MTGVVYAERNPFPLRVTPYSDEPAHALLVRTAARNGTSMFSTVFKRCGILYGRGVALVDVGLVAYLCGAEPEALERASARRSPDEVSLLGQSLRNEHLGGWFRRWCPLCLQEEPYHRVWWDISYLTCCPVHNVELVGRCECGKPLVHGGQGITHCKEEHDLRTVACTPVDPSELAAERYIVRRLLGRPRARSDLLDAVSLGQAIHVMERLGRAALAEDLDVEGARKVVGIRRLLSTGFDVVSTLPNGFDVILDRLLASRTDDQLRSIGSAYGTLRTWIFDRARQSPDCPLIAALKDRITVHAAANFVSPTRMVIDDRPTDGVIGTDVATRCGLPYQTFLRLAQTLGFDIQMPRARRPALVPAAQVETIVDRITGLRTMKQVQDSLGVTQARVIDFADRGWLPYVCRPYDRANPKGKRGDRPDRPLRERPPNTWFFESDAARAFMQSLEEKVQAKTSAPAGDLVDVLWLTRMFTSTVAVIELVLAGKLPIRKIDLARPGLQGYLLSRAEAGALLKLARRQGQPLRAAAPLAGLNYNQLRSCVNAGLVETSGSGTSLSVTDEAIAAFKATYVRATELAETFGVKDSRLVIRYLREHGVEPLQVDAELGMTLYLRDVAGPAAESLPPPVKFASSRERARYQREKGLAVQATRKSYEVSPDWNKRGSDRSGLIKK